MGSFEWEGVHVKVHLLRYLLGRLPAPVEFDVEEHLLGCVACLTECDALAVIATLMAILPPDAVRTVEGSGPDELPRALWTANLSAVSGTPHPPPPR